MLRVSTCLLVAIPALVAGQVRAELVTNGSFEEALATGWTASGTVGVTAVQGASSGTRAAAFGAGNGSNNGVLSQELATAPGQPYLLSLDYSAFGDPGTAISPRTQSLEITISGDTTLAQGTVTAVGSGFSGDQAFANYPIRFVADSSSTTLEFADASTLTASIDGMLDSVSVTEVDDACAVPSLVSNGSFEPGLSGWMASGAVGAVGFTGTTDGFRAAVFGAAQQPSTGVLTQTLTTLPGARYRVAFDYGAYGVADPQSLRVTATGITVLLDEEVTALGAGTATSFAPYAFDFVADGASAVIEFTDESSVSAGVDGVLDSVSVFADFDVDGVPDACEHPVPALSPTGAVAMALALALVGSVAGRRYSRAPGHQTVGYR